MQEAADLTPLALGLLAAHAVVLYAAHLGGKAMAHIAGLRPHSGRHSRTRRSA